MLRLRLELSEAYWTGQLTPVTELGSSARGKLSKVLASPQLRISDSSAANLSYPPAFVKQCLNIPGIQFNAASHVASSFTHTCPYLTTSSATTFFYRVVAAVITNDLVLLTLWCSCQIFAEVPGTVFDSLSCFQFRYMVSRNFAISDLLRRFNKHFHGTMDTTGTAMRCRFN